MKRVLITFFSLFFIVFQVQSQQTDFGTLRLKAGGGYAHDFPGLNGWTAYGECSFQMLPRLEGAVGVKRAQLKGFPRTSTVQEYTNATTFDFTLYYIPIETETQLIRVGLGYTMSAYSIRRSFPVISGTGPDKATNWPVQDQKSRTHGVNLVTEYEYMIPETPVSVGLRASLFKAYDRVSYVGSFIGLRF